MRRVPTVIVSGILTVGMMLLGAGSSAAADVQGPATPTITNVEVKPTSIQLDFGADDGGVPVESFEVYATELSTNEQVYQASSDRSGRADIQNLTPNTVYEIEVRAQAAGTTATVAATLTTPHHAPGHPFIFAKAIHATAVELRLNEPVADFIPAGQEGIGPISEYVLDIAARDGSTFERRTVDVPQESYWVDGLTPNTRYLFILTAVGPGGETSNEHSFQTPPASPSVSIETATRDSITVRVTDGSATAPGRARLAAAPAAAVDEITYTLSLTTGGVTVQTAQLARPGLHTFAGLQPGTAYSVSVRASNQTASSETTALAVSTDAAPIDSDSTPGASTNVDTGSGSVSTASPVVDASTPSANQKRTDVLAATGSEAPMSLLAIAFALVGVGASTIVLARRRLLRS